MDATYHIDLDSFSLERFEASLASRELIPSRQLLKEKLRRRFKILETHGITTLGELIRALKTKPLIEAFAKKTGLEVNYLTVLKREASSYLPNPVKLDKFPGIDRHVVAGMEQAGIRNTKHLFEKTLTPKAKRQLLEQSKISAKDLDELIALSDLSRLYGVGPVFARILYDIGIESVHAFVSHNAEEIIAIYEQATGRKADFTPSDIRFTLEMSAQLYSTPPAT